MILLTCLGVLLLLVILWWCIDYYNHFKGIVNIPMPKILLPVVGHLLYVTSIDNAYWDLHRLAMTVGKYKSIRGALGFFYCIGVCDPEMLEELMTSTNVINKSNIYSFLHNWLGTGLLTSENEKWHVRRKMLTPAYHFRILEQFIDVFDKNANILATKLAAEVGNDSTDVFPYVTLCTLDTICETAMGTSVGAQECSDSEYVKAIKKLSMIIVIRTTNVLKQFDWIYRFTRDYQEEQKSLKVVHNYTMSVIQSRRAELLGKRTIKDAVLQEISDESNDLGYKAKMPFLDVLLQATLNGEPLSDEDIREEVDTFMFEGHDTTSSAISFCIYNIAKHSHVQTLAFEEQTSIFGDDDRETTYQDLQSMKYLEMIIKETLRLYPSVPIYARKVTKDFDFRGSTFKKGTELGFLVYTLHRNPEIYPNPEVFDPERFTLEETAKRHPFAYLPFSAGFRNCVGQKFAMLEMKATLSKLLREFVFSEIAGHTLQLKTGLILASKTGTRVKINKR